MPSHLFRHAHQSYGGLLPLVDIGTTFWLAVYVLAIVGGFRNRTYAIPLVAICSNFSWEIIAAVYRPAPFLWWHIGDILWMCLDAAIVWTLLRYGRRQQQIPEIEQGFYLIVGATFGFAFIVQMTLMRALHDEFGFTDAYVIATIMSVLFIFMHFARRTPDSTTYAIAWCKLLGNGLTSVGVIVDFSELHGHKASLPLLVTLASFVFLLDAGYVGLLARARRAAAASLQIPSSSRVASAA